MHVRIHLMEDAITELTGEWMASRQTRSIFNDLQVDAVGVTIKTFDELLVFIPMHQIRRIEEIEK